MGVDGAGLPGFRVCPSPTENCPKKRSGKYRYPHDVHVLHQGVDLMQDGGKTNLGPIFQQGNRNRGGVLLRPTSCGGGQEGVILSPRSRNRQLLQEWHTHHTADAALTTELYRAHAARKIVVAMEAIVVDEFKCDAKGLFPAFVFETKASAEGWTVEQRAAHGLDIVLPCGLILQPHGCPKSIHDRCMTNLHDLRTMTREQCEETAWTISRRVSEAVHDIVQDFHTKTTKKATGVKEGVPQVTVAVHDSPDSNPPITTIVIASMYRHDILTTHWNKLRVLYRLHCAECDPNAEEFPLRVAVLLMRYFTLTGAVDSGTAQRESGWHGSVPYPVFQAISAQLQEAPFVECFSSPLNSTASYFFSAFPDVDCFFGSLGSYFDCVPVRGVFEANPPFDIVIATRMARAMCEAVIQGNSNAPAGLHFLIVMPYSDKGKQLPSTEAVLGVLHEDQYKEGVLVSERTVSAASAPYVDGYQHCIANSYFLTHLDTRMFHLQRRGEQATDQVSDALKVIEEIAQCWEAMRPAPKRSSDETR